jgi:hypothetical protein
VTDEIPRCTATNSRGSRCSRRPILGGTVCPTHGGQAPQVRAAAERRLVERAAVLAVETYGLPRTISPQDALLEEVHRTAGHVAWLAAVVADIEQQDLVWGKTRDKIGGEDQGTTYEAKPNAWLVLYQAERKHLVDVTKAAISAGIEERRVQLAESQGQLLATVVRNILGDLALTPEQQGMAAGVIQRRLREAAVAGELEQGSVA